MSKKIKYWIIIALILFPLNFLKNHLVLLNSSHFVYSGEIINNDGSDTVVNPFGNINFSSGDNAAYLSLSDDEFDELPTEFSGRYLLICRENNNLNTLKNNFNFKINGGDKGTVVSSISFYKNRKLVFSSSIEIRDGYIGIQNKHTGWAECRGENYYTLINCLSKFDVVF